MIRLGCLAFLVLFVSIPVIAAQFLPWWGVILVLLAEFAGLVIAIPLAIRWGIKRLIGRLFDAKSGVLRNAKVEVHSVTLVARPPRVVNRDVNETLELPGTIGVDPQGDFAPPPSEGNPNVVEGEVIDPNEPAESDPPGTRYVRVDCVIAPHAKRVTPMAYWDPSDLRLIPYGRKVSMLQESPDTSEAEPVTVKLVREGGIRQELEDSKVTGEQRMEFIFRCPPQIRDRVKFQYYFETFGDLVIPN